MSQNKVELIGFYGGDELHACSAWTSTSRELTPEKRGRMDKMLFRLAKDGHHTPFEKSAIHFLITTDIATHIQILKHRIGVSFNAESARYKELLEDKNYTPSDWPLDELRRLERFQKLGDKMYHRTMKNLEAAGLSRGRAKESARYYKTYASQLQADVMFNFRSLMHFGGLRYAVDAQKEVCDLAGEMLRKTLETGAFNVSLDAFGYIENGAIRAPKKKVK